MSSCNIVETTTLASRYAGCNGHGLPCSVACNVSKYRLSEFKIMIMSFTRFTLHHTWTTQELVVLVKAAVMSACGDCYQPCGPVNKKGEVECVPARAAGMLAKAG